MPALSIPVALCFKGTNLLLKLFDLGLHLLLLTQENHECLVGVGHRHLSIDLVVLPVHLCELPHAVDEDKADALEYQTNEIHEVPRGKLLNGDELVVQRIQLKCLEEHSLEDVLLILKNERHNETSCLYHLYQLVALGGALLKQKLVVLFKRHTAFQKTLGHGSLYRFFNGKNAVNVFNTTTENFNELRIQLLESIKVQQILSDHLQILPALFEDVSHTHQSEADRQLSEVLQHQNRPNDVHQRHECSHVTSYSRNYVHHAHKLNVEVLFCVLEVERDDHI